MQNPVGLANGVPELKAYLAVTRNILGPCGENIKGLTPELISGEARLDSRTEPHAHSAFGRNTS